MYAVSRKIQTSPSLFDHPRNETCPFEISRDGLKRLLIVIVNNIIAVYSNDFGLGEEIVSARILSVLREKHL